MAYRAHGRRGTPHRRADRRPGRPAAVHRLRHRDQARCTPRTTSPATSRSASASPATTRTPAARTARCTASRRGRCASTRATRRRRSPTSATATCSRKGGDRPVDGVRPADPARPGLRRPALPRRGRPHRRRDRHDRRHAHGVRRDPARRGLDVDDDQRARRRSCCCSTRSSARSRASEPSKLRGTTQNDILKEYIARGNFIYPPEGAMRLTTDLFAYCKENVPKWNTISISRLPLPREGLLGRPGGRVHAVERHRLRAGGDRRGPEGRRLRAAPGVLLQRPQPRLPGGREVPRRPADVGARS